VKAGAAYLVTATIKVLPVNATDPKQRYLNLTVVPAGGGTFRITGTVPTQGPDASGKIYLTTTVTGVFTPAANGEGLAVTSPYPGRNLGAFTGFIQLTKIQLSNVTSAGSGGLKVAKVAPAKVAPAKSAVKAKVAPAKVVPAKSAVKAKIATVKKSISKKAH